MQSLSDTDFSSLLSFRTELRRFNHWSESQAKGVGLTHMQHQLLLAVRGHQDGRGPTITQVSSYLYLRHHSTVELVNRAEAGGWVARNRDPDDARVVRLTLTAKGEHAIDALSETHLQELRRLAPLLDHMEDGLE